MRRRRWLAALLSLAAVLLLAACTPDVGSGARATPPLGSLDRPQDVAWAALERYLRGFATGDFREMAGVSTAAARQYADYRVAGLRFGEATPPVAQLTLPAPEDVEVRSDERVRFRTRATLAFSSGTVVELEDFRVLRVEGRWLVETYTRDGLPLEDFIRDGAGTVAEGDLEVANPLVFRDPVAGDLAVVLELTNRMARPVDLATYRATFVAADSGRRYPIEFTGPGSVQAGATADLALVFTDVDDAAAGGAVTVRFLDGDGAVIQALELPVAPFREG